MRVISERARRFQFPKFNSYLITINVRSAPPGGRWAGTARAAAGGTPTATRPPRDRFRPRPYASVAHIDIRIRGAHTHPRTAANRQNSHGETATFRRLRACALRPGSVAGRIGYRGRTVGTPDPERRVGGGADNDRRQKGNVEQYSDTCQRVGLWAAARPRAPPASHTYHCAPMWPGLEAVGGELLPTEQPMELLVIKRAPS